MILSGLESLLKSSNRANASEINLNVLKIISIKLKIILKPFKIKI
jgi:hypothetical protein